MMDTNRSLEQIIVDLGLNLPFTKGQIINVRNCWHFSTPGEFVEYFFIDEQDFIDGMNRIYFVASQINIVILAFCLMDNHIHFVLYGSFDECNRFMHEFVRRTSMHISRKYNERHKLSEVPVHHQEIGDLTYLRTCICYVIKNPPQAGLPYNAYDYPWSSGALYMRKMASGDSFPPSSWTSARWMLPNTCFQDSSEMSGRKLKAILKSNENINEGLKMIGDMIFPGEYVAVDLVNNIFKTHKSFNYMLCRTQDSDVESKGGSISRLSIPNQEMRQHKTEVCKELFGVDTIRTLPTEKRLILAKVLRSRYNSSPKQLAKMCGLIYNEVKHLL